MSPNPRIRPEFFLEHRPSWLPQGLLWRVVLAVYLALGIWQAFLGSALVAAACLVVAGATSPRLRERLGATRIASGLWPWR